jgi:hypothetical protein
MNMYQLKQIPSEAKIRKYLRHAVFGGPQVFCPECKHEYLDVSRGRSYKGVILCQFCF